MGLFDIFSSKKGKGSPLKCQNCQADIDSSMERCPKCGTHLSSMFRLRCPKCGESNEWDAQKCSKCKWDFKAPSQPSKRRYTCPRCGYQADYFMLRCPACGVKFA